MARPTGDLINPQLSLWGDWTRNRPGELAPVIRWSGDELEMIELMWGLRPRDPAIDRAIINLRSEGRCFESHRCLVPAAEFFFPDPSGHGRWRFTMVDGESFYFAGIWRPAREDWPEAYAVLTTAANPDVAPCKDRQMAVIPRGAQMDWLDHRVPEEDLLRPLPAGSFRGQRVR